MVSNCLIEAIKAKIKDPKNVQIICLKKEWNHGDLHFYWICKGEVYHYEALSRNAPFLFKGTLKHLSLESFEAFILRSLARTKPNLDKTIVAKKLNFPSLNQPGMLKWETYCPEFELFKVPKKTKLAKLLMVKSSNEEIKIMKVEDFKKEDYEYADWKYISPYCQEFRLFGVKES